MHIQSGLNRCVVIPATSVITDKNGSVVWIQNENGSFSCKKVSVGMQSEHEVQVLSGLQASESVVVSGAYLLNSELILRKGTLAEATDKL